MMRLKALFTLLLLANQNVAGKPALRQKRETDRDTSSGGNYEPTLPEKEDGMNDDYYNFGNESHLHFFSHHNHSISNAAQQRRTQKEDNCQNLVYNGNFESGSTAKWSHWDGGVLRAVAGAGGNGDNALYAANGSPMQNIRTGCLKEGKVYEVSLKYKIRDKNGFKLSCEDEDCPKLSLRTSVGNFKASKTIASGAGLSHTLGWFYMYGMFTADANDAKPNSELRIHFFDIARGNGIVIDDVSITEKPKDCSRELVMNSDLQRGFHAYWKSRGSGVLEQAFVDGTTAVRISKRSQASHGLTFEANKFLDLRCFEAGSTLQFSVDFKLFNKGTAIGASCDWSTTSVDSSCPSIRIIAYDASAPKKIAWMERLYKGAYKRQWSRKSLNRFQTSVVVPKALVNPVKVFIFVKDFSAKWDLALDNFSITDVNKQQGPTPAPSRTKSPRPTPKPTRGSSPTPPQAPRTPSPTRFTIPPGAENKCPKTGQSVQVSDPSRPFTVSNNLCTLTRITTDRVGNVVAVVPLARSYDRNDWESAAGDYAASVFSSSRIKCSSGSCSIPSLPKLETREIYALSSYQDTSHTTKDKRARFLEMATFGTTSKDLNKWKTNEAAWVENQISLPLTSHREYFRKRANPRWQFSQNVGRSDHPCAQNSRWRKFTITTKDINFGPNRNPLSGELYIKNTTSAIDKSTGKRVAKGPYILFVDGRARTVVDKLRWEWSEINQQFPSWDPDFGYEMCSGPDNPMGMYVGGPIHLKTKRFNGYPDGLCLKVLSNPAVNFKGFESYMGGNVLQLTNAHKLKVIDNDDMYLLKTKLTHKLCNKLPAQAEDFDAPVFAIHPKEGLLQWDPRLMLQENTPESPLRGGGGSVVVATAGKTTCSNVPRTFLNADKCIFTSSPAACGTATAPDVKIQLNQTTILKLHQLTGRYLYAIEGLEVKQPSSNEQIDHPCTKGVRSRWEKFGNKCRNPSRLNSKTRDTLTNLLAKSDDSNPFIRDVTFRSGMACDRKDVEVEIEIQVGNTCWKHIHPDKLSVFDLTDWTRDHPGNAFASDKKRPNPIKKWLDGGKYFIRYDGRTHPLSRWDTHHTSFEYVGRFGDEVNYRDLPNELRLQQVVEHYSDPTVALGKFVVVCGSPGEVAGVPQLGSHFDVTTDAKRDSTDDHDLARQRETVWTMVALYSNDQLRQRMAWALSQVLAIAKTSITVQETDTEVFLQHYDIMVRHAFGNYLDVLKEISYSPLMAENLSYLESKSSAYVFQEHSRIEFADENFAREIMQLFTTGLILLNSDGTPKLDGKGKVQQVYDNDDVRSVSRVWTGFQRQQPRGNIESSDSENRIDPMVVVAEWHDRFPKSNLDGGFVGDGYPLCVDLPKRQFLRKGSRFRFLGSSALPELMSDDPLFSKRFILNKQTSSLASVLCSKKDGKCRYPAEVTLDRNLPCDKHECKVDTVRVVQAAQGFFYEYIEPPCVEHAFFEKAMKLNLKRSTQQAVCGNPELPIATSACCEKPSLFVHAVSDNLYDVERMTFKTQDKRCSDLGRRSCEYDTVDKDAEKHLSNEVYHWAFTPCAIQAKINPVGEVAIVHNVEGNKVLHVNKDTTNYFKVAWQGNDFPKKESANCGACQTVDGSSCLCDTTVKEAMVFSSNPSDSESIIAALQIGAPDPSSFEPETYSSVTLNGFTVYRTGRGYSTDTIFKVTDGVGRTRFLKNVRSTVRVAGGFSFRNPVHFMSLVPSETNARNAAYEVDSLLEHLFYHDNTAPFLCKLLIQRFGFSNPSPRYVKVCSTAFRTGKYVSGGKSFGKRKYGDLAATVASILLDREARSVVLDVDPSQGSIREPLVRVISFMRSMDYTGKASAALPSPMVVFNDLNRLIGQAPHEIESVFSFFLPEYKPEGPVSAGTLVSPEAQMADQPKVVGLLNGIHSMIRHGLSSCDYGFGFGTDDESNPNRCSDDGRYKFSSGVLTYRPAASSTEGIVNELSTLLTSGRLNLDSRKSVVAAYDDAAKKAGTLAGLRLAQELISTTPEFHATNPVQFSGDRRPAITPPSGSEKTPYKAIVMIMFAGGCDSFNMLVPRNCAAYTRYANARRPVQLAQASLLPIDGSGQVGCSTFGLHEKLPALQKLYNDKDLLFFSNTGVLGRPSKKETYEKDTPTQLFAHNTMQLETKLVDVHRKAPAGTGVLGRLANALSINGKSVGSISIDATSAALVGKQGVSPPIVTLSNTGVNRFMPQDSATMTRASMVQAIEGFNNATKPDSSFFASTWSSSLSQSLLQNEELFQTLKATSVNEYFGESDIGKQLEVVSRLIKARKTRRKDADLFYVEYGDWDHHAQLTQDLSDKFVEVNEAVTAFTAEMKKQRMWDSVTVVQVSEFGRTLSPNSGGGTDHAFGGNYFMFGGSVRGGRILGQYPSDMSEKSDINLGRGRLIPTTSWDQIWPGIAQWAGVFGKGSLDMICPNRNKFPFFFERDKLFSSG